MCNNNIFNRVAGLTRFLVGLLWLGSALAITPAYSANVTFTGILLDVFVDTGSSVYAGASMGDPFAGNFVYGNSELQASSIYSEPNERNWSFVGGSFGGTITDGVTPTAGLGVDVNVENDWALNADEALLIGTLTGGPVSSGTLVDTWSVYSLTSGASYVPAPTPEDPLNENLVNGMDFGMGFISLGGFLYSGLGYQSLPPGLGDVNAGFFYIEEADAAGNTQFLALGKLTTSMAVVPVPAAVWLFGSGLLGLIGIARRKR